MKLKTVAQVIAIAFVFGCQSMNIEQVRILAKKGNSDAQCQLAHLYEKGRGVSANTDSSIHYYRISAESGNVKAQKILLKQAVKWLCCCSADSWGDVLLWRRSSPRLP